MLIIPLKSESFIMKSVKILAFFSPNYFLNWYQTIKTVLLETTFQCSIDCFNCLLHILCHSSSSDSWKRRTSIFNHGIGALWAPVALAQRHYRIHTLRVRTLAFGLKMKHFNVPLTVLIVCSIYGVKYSLYNGNILRQESARRAPIKKFVAPYDAIESFSISQY